MAVTIRFVLNGAGIREILDSAKTRALLSRKALAVAAQVKAANIRVENTPGDKALPIEVRVTGTGVRARARVIINHASGVNVEAKHGILGRSLDAAKAVE